MQTNSLTPPPAKSSSNMIPALSVASAKLRAAPSRQSHLSLVKFASRSDVTTSGAPLLPMMMLSVLSRKGSHENETPMDCDGNQMPDVAFPCSAPPKLFPLYTPASSSPKHFLGKQSCEGVDDQEGSACTKAKRGVSTFETKTDVVYVRLGDTEGSDSLIAFPNSNDEDCEEVCLSRRSNIFPYCSSTTETVGEDYGRRKRSTS